MDSLFAFPEILGGWPIQARVWLEWVIYAEVKLCTGSRSRSCGEPFVVCPGELDGRKMENTVPRYGPFARDFT